MSFHKTKISRKFRGLVEGSLLTVGLCVCTIAQAAGKIPIPKPANAVGYRVLTFSSKFTRRTVDINQTGRPGFQWYLWNFFGSRARPAEVRLNPDNSLTLFGEPTNLNAQIATATPTKTSSGFAGIAFGGGAYIEGKLKFNPKSVGQVDNIGHPSFWSMALEHLTGYGTPAKKPGVAVFEHFIEADFFEYDLLGYVHVDNVYGGAIHDWYGVWKHTCPVGFCNVTTPFIKKWVPNDTNFQNYHTFGFLWVPATMGALGYAQYYFDNVPVGKRVEWRSYKGQLEPTKNPGTAFSIMDVQHLVLILGTGINQPMTVQSINVYQSSSTGNLMN